MLQLLGGTNIAFMKYRRLAYMISGALVLATAVWLMVNGGPRYSVDFTGGTLLQVRSRAPLPADQVRSALQAAGFPDVELQQLAGEARNEFMIRMKGSGQQDPFPAIQRAIQARFAARGKGRCERSGARERRWQARQDSRHRRTSDRTRRNS